MNSQIEKLYAIAGKTRRLLVGLMSGTSLDGLDVALCTFEGSGRDSVIELLQFETVPYQDDFKAEVTSVFSKKQVDLEKLCLLNAWIGTKHGQMVLDCLQKWNVDKTTVDLVASHGQTIFHAPKALHGFEKFPNATLQIGDGDHIAVTTGIITLSDFRQKHVAAGGEGAPLAAYGDYLIFSKKGQNRIMLNIGGIANLTYLPGNLNTNEVFCSDTGPGNTMMDAFVQKQWPGKFYDENAALAKSGTANRELLAALMEHPFFEQPFPKTTGPELFNLQYLANAQQQSNTQGLSSADVMATLSLFSASTICNAIKRVTGDNSDFHFYVSGGGMHNPLLMQHIEAQLPGVHFKSTDQLEVNPDAKEAVLFAVLANETICGGQTDFGVGRNGVPNVCMGKISFPA